MKVARVFTNNRKKSFVIETKERVLEFPFSALSLKPSKTNPVVEVKPDPEVAKEGFTYRLRSGAEDTVLMEQVLASVGDPEVIRRRLLYELTCEAQKAAQHKRITKRALARRIGIQPAQLYRLLDQTFYGKSVDQMIRVLTALGREVKFTTEAA